MKKLKSHLLPSLYTLVWICLLSWPTTQLSAAPRDLNDLCQDYILQTKRIRIPGYDTAFNPSIVRWRDTVLMCFRTRDPQTLATDRIGIVRLNTDMDPIGVPQILDGPSRIFSSHPWPQDPRLLTIDDNLYMIYSDLVSTDRGEFRRMFIADLIENDGHFYTGHPEYYLSYEQELKNLQEKNWVPFNYEGALLLGYSIIPHRIFVPIPGKRQCQTVAITGANIAWSWGEVRGGTTALKVDGQYLAFFHSIKAMATVQSDGKQISHYFMAPYTFESQPPFRVTSMPRVPLMAQSFYDGPMYQTWKPLRVVFPCGFILDEDFIWISYGKQDHEMWVAKIDRKKMMKSLLPISTTK